MSRFNGGPPTLPEPFTASSSSREGQRLAARSSARRRRALNHSPCTCHLGRDGRWPSALNSPRPIPDLRPGGPPSAGKRRALPEPFTTCSSSREGPRPAVRLQPGSPPSAGKRRALPNPNRILRFKLSSRICIRPWNHRNANTPLICPMLNDTTNRRSSSSPFAPRNENPPLPISACTRS